MSEMLNRTWNYLSSNLSSPLSSTSSSSSGPRWTVPDADLGKSAHLSASLAQFIQALYDCETIQDEEQLVSNHLGQIEQRLKDPKLKPHAIADCLVRVLACHILGFDVTFAHIYALQLAQKGNILEKKMGYLACTLLLEEKSEETLLLINTILKDLRSKNVVEINTALTAAIYLIPKEVAPMMATVLLEKTTHTKDFIRKKALVCLEKLLDDDASLRQVLEPRIRHCLSDRDPGVAGTAVQVLTKLYRGKETTDNSSTCDLSLVPSLLQFLEQILADKLPKEYIYGSMPAPWLQINILQLLHQIVTKSTSTDPATLDSIGQMVGQAMDKAAFKETVGQAVIYECIQVISGLNQRLDTKVPGTSKAIAFVNKFLLSKHNNVKYMGLSGLECMLRSCPPDLTDAQEENVFQCLSHFDESIQRKTLSLIFSLANERNGSVVCQKLLHHLKTTKDPYLAEDLGRKVKALTLKLNLSLEIYVSLLFNVLQFVPKDSQAIRESVLSDIKTALAQEDTEDALKEDARVRVGERLTRKLECHCLMDETAGGKTVAEKAEKGGGGSANRNLAFYIWCLSQFRGSKEEDPLVIICKNGLECLKNPKQNGLVLVACLNSILDIYVRDSADWDISKESEKEVVSEFVGKCLSMDSVPGMVCDLALEVSTLLKCLSEERGLLNPLEEEEEDDSDEMLDFLDEQVTEQLVNRTCEPYRFQNRLVERAKAEMASSASGAGASAGRLKLDTYQTLASSLISENSGGKERTTSRSQSDKSQSESVQVWSFKGRAKSPLTTPPSPPPEPKASKHKGLDAEELWNV